MLPGTIKISGETILDEEITDIIDALSEGKICLLSFRNCSFTDEQLGTVLEGVASCKNILQLNLSLDIINNDWRAQQLAKSINKNRSLQSFQIHGSCVYGAAMTELLNAIVLHPNLRSVDLGDCQLNDDDCDALMLLVGPKGTRPGIRDLTLSANPGITPLGWSRLFIRMVKTASLQSLYLDYNEINDTAGAALIAFIANCKKLQVLDVEGCRVTETFGKLLLHVIQTRSFALKMINLTETEVTEETQKAVQSSLVNTPSMSCVSLKSASSSSSITATQDKEHNLTPRINTDITLKPQTLATVSLPEGIAQYVKVLETTNDDELEMIEKGLKVGDSIQDNSLHVGSTIQYNAGTLETESNDSKQVVNLSTTDKHETKALESNETESTVKNNGSKSVSPSLPHFTNKRTVPDLIKSETMPTFAIPPLLTFGEDIEVDQLVNTGSTIETDSAADEDATHSTFYLGRSSDVITEGAMVELVEVRYEGKRLFKNTTSSAEVNSKNYDYKPSLFSNSLSEDTPKISTSPHSSQVADHTNYSHETETQASSLYKQKLGLHQLVINEVPSIISLPEEKLEVIEKAESKPVFSSFNKRDIIKTPEQIGQMDNEQIKTLDPLYSTGDKRELASAKDTILENSLSSLRSSKNDLEVEQILSVAENIVEKHNHTIQYEDDDDDIVFGATANSFRLAKHDHCDILEDDTRRLDMDYDDDDDIVCG